MWKKYKILIIIILAVIILTAGYFIYTKMSKPDLASKFKESLSKVTAANPGAKGAEPILLALIDMGAITAQEKQEIYNKMDSVDTSTIASAITNANNYANARLSGLSHADSLNKIISLEQ